MCFFRSIECSPPILGDFSFDLVPVDLLSNQDFKLSSINPESFKEEANYGNYAGK